VALAVLLAVPVSGSAQSIGSSDANCRNFIAKKVRTLTATVLLEKIRCEDKRLRGVIAAAVDCNDLGNAGFPASSTTKIATAASRLTSKIGTNCASPASSPAGNGYTTCASPCDATVPAISTYTDVANCLVCLAKEQARADVQTAYGNSPPVQGGKTDAWRCQDSRVGRAQRTYAKAKMKQQQTCQYKEDRGKIGSVACASADLTGAVARAAQTLSTKINKCTDTDLAALTSCSTTVAAEQTCAKTAADALADTLFGYVYPDRPTPTPTATATLTRTPTQTPTPSLTPTTGPCPSSSFLNVSSAPGAGAGYPAPTLSVTCSGSTVTVHSNGIPTYTFVATTPNGLAAQNYNFTFPRAPAVAASTTNIPLLGSIGVAVNGLPLFGPNEATTPDYYGDAVANALLDQCMGHTGPGGTYHYHALLVKCLIASALGTSTPWNDPDPPSTEASPIIAYAFDGFPIYGPYECTDGSCTQVQELFSGWDQTTYQAGTTGCASSSLCDTTHVCTDVMINGAQTTACVPKTCAWSNSDYVARAGTQYLDQCNGHVGPNGDYHYHATATFPYLLGCYRGTPTNNGGNGTPPGGTCS